MTKQTLKRLIFCISYFAVIIAAVLVILAKLIPTASDIITLIAGIVCFATCILSAGYYAASRRSAAYFVLLCFTVIGAIAVYILL